MILTTPGFRLSAPTLGCFALGDLVVDLLEDEHEGVAVVALKLLHGRPVEHDPVALHGEDAGAVHRCVTRRMLPGSFEELGPLGRWRPGETQRNAVEGATSRPVVERLRD